MKELTQRQAQVLDYLRRSYREKGYAPTRQEIATHLGIISTNGVDNHLNALEKKGKIRRIDAISRGTVLVDPTEHAGRPKTCDPVLVPFPWSPGASVRMDPKLLGLVPSGLPSSPRAT